MTHEEAKAVFKSFFVAFPTYRSWLESTDEPQATLDGWCEVISPLEYEHGVEAVRRYRMGESSLPEAYHKDRLALDIRAVAGRVRDQAAKVERMERERTERERRNVVQSRWAYDIGIIGRRATALGLSLRAGKISRGEHDRRLWTLRDMARMQGARRDFDADFPVELAKRDEAGNVMEGSHA